MDIVIKEKYLESLMQLGDAALGQIVRAMIEYVVDGKMPDKILPDEVKLLLPIIMYDLYNDQTI